MMAVMMMAALSMTFTVNPDGSCKVEVEMTLPPIPAELAAEMPGAPPPEEMIKQFARRFVGTRPTPSGDMAEVWANVTLTKNPDGSCTFKGTAYAKDVTKAQLLPAANRDAATWAKDDQGRMTLTLNLAGDRGAGPVRPQPNDEQTILRMNEFRNRLAEEGKVLDKFLPGMRMEFAFRLPGTAAGVEGFTKAADGSLRKLVEGPKILADLKALAADDEKLKACIKAGHDPMEDVMMKHMGGVLKARVEGELKPQFDYDAEVKAAKEAFPKMMEKLGLQEMPK
jgi:hypothetical protein